VQVSSDSDADLQAIGHDAKGRAQYRYSAAHTDRASQAKFERLRAFEAERQQILDRAGAEVAAHGALPSELTAEHPGPSHAGPPTPDPSSLHTEDT